MGDSYRFEFENIAEYANLAWWEGFQDPELNRLITLALNNNQDLKVATARVLEFYAKYRVVFSKFFPEVTLESTIDRIKLSEDINYQPLSPFIPRINYLYSLFENISYEVDFWGKIRNQAESARSTYLSQVYNRRNVIVSLVSSVASAYVQLKQNIAQKKISELTFESRKKSLEIAQLRFEGGLVSKMEVNQAASECYIAELQIKNFEILIAEQEDLISVLIGQAPGPIEGGVLLTDLVSPPSIPAGLPVNLLENRPDILQAEEQILAANADVGVARAAFLPQITLTGAFGQRTTQSSQLFDSTAALFDAAMDTLQPLFTGWRLTNQLKEQEAILIETLHAYQQTILTALKEVDDALIQHEKAKEKIVLQEERVEVLAEYLELATLRYENGQNDYLTVLNAENSLFAAELEQANTQGDLYFSLISLYKALGQGWNTAPEVDVSNR
jgi:multidrug efflux system outer membrane protein